MLPYRNIRDLGGVSAMLQAIVSGSSRRPNEAKTSIGEKDIYMSSVLKFGYNVSTVQKYLNTIYVRLSARENAR